jgi:DinB superfamily
MTPAERHSKIALYQQADELLTRALNQFPKEMWQYKPGPDRWSIHEIIVHIADSEANSYIRCRRFIAETGKTVMAYDENRWADLLNYHGQSPEDALELFRLLRRMSHRLIKDLPEAVWSNTVDHPENGIMTMDDWLSVYTNHVPEHIQQMQATHAAWLVERKGQQPDPDTSLFKLSEK